MHRIDSIMEMGIERIYSFGKTRIGRYSIVGKGHASVVVLARHRMYGAVGLKIRRMDSKRTSLLDEARFLDVAYPHGYTPRVYLYTDDFIVRSYIDGLTVEEFLNRVRDKSSIAILVKNLLLAAHKLDQLSIDVTELSRPYRQVVLLCGDPSKPFIIDLESGRYHLEPCNVTRIINFALFGGAQGAGIRELLGLNKDRVEQLVKLARLYRNLNHSLREEVFNKVLTLIDT